MTSNRTTRGRYDWLFAAKIALILVAVALAYFPALSAGFVWDDEPLITANPLLRSLSGLAEIWSGSRTADYFPLTNTLFWIEFHLFGQDPIGYHAVNILLQAANAILVWRVLRRLEIPGAFLAGLIFAIHPVHAESVAWISELKNLLSMFFFLIALLCFFEVEEKRVLRGTVAYAASLLSFLLALLSKTQVVFLPVVLLLCAWWRNSNRGTIHSASGQQHGNQTPQFHREIVRTLPFFFIALALGLVTIWFQNRGIGGEDVVLGSLSRRLVNAGMAMCWYAKQVFLPVRLTTVYSPWRFDSPSPLEWLPLIALVGVMATLWVLRARRGGGFFFAFAYFVIALLPVVGLLRMSYARSGTLVADHLQYFADISLIALFSTGVARLWASRQRAIRITVGTLVLLLLGAMGSYTWARAKVYRNEETLWQDNFSKNPNAWQGHNRIGQLFFNQGRFLEAAQHFEQAAELKPELADNYNSLGLAYCRLNRFEEGIAEYRKGLELKEEKPSTSKSEPTATMRTNLANALTITGNNFSESDSRKAMERYQEAIIEYEKALEIEPEQPAIHRNLGILLARLGRNDEAIAHLRKVLQLVPDEPLARETLDALESQRR